MNELIKLENIKIGVDALDWKDAIRKAGMLLENAGSIKKEYIENMIKSVETLGPYIVLMPGFALGHAAPSDDVLSNDLSLITLKNPINFGSEANDPVKVVMCLACKDNSSHIETIQKIALKLMQENALEDILSSNDEKELYEYINSNISLIKLSDNYKEQLNEMLDEWTEYNNAHPEANNSPYAIFKNDYHDFDNYLNNLEVLEEKDGLVPDSTFFLYDGDDDKFIGAINIRHYLNDALLKEGGHIGDGIRPSERRKGYATKMIKLALDECKKLGINEVLLTCDKDNVGSSKSIIKNGGILENEFVNSEGKVEQRYWIKLS